MTEKLQQQIKKELEGKDQITDATLQSMLENIGNPDPVLRDEVIYLGWIKLLEENRWNLSQKRGLLEEIMNQQLLFNGIEDVSDAVFTRSFTALLLVLLIADDEIRPWLTTSEKEWIISNTLLYMSQEKDNRGLVEGKGWAHAFAHGADLLGALSQLDSLTSEHVVEMLACMSRALIEIENFLYGEDDRFAFAIVNFVEKNKISEDLLSQWILTQNQRLKETEAYNICWYHFLLTLTLTLKLKEIEMPKVNQAAMAFFRWNLETFS